LKKHILAIIAIVCAVAAVVFCFRSCVVTEKYRKQKLAYTELRAITNADHRIQLDIIAEREKVITLQNEEITKYVGQVKVKDAKIKALSAQLDELQNVEPSQPELENEPLVINLRGQVARLTEMFTLSQGVVADKDKIILAWEVKYNAQVDISLAWKKSYDEEHALRLSCESLNKALESRVGLFRLKGKVLTVATAITAGYIGYRLIKDAAK